MKNNYYPIIFAFLLLLLAGCASSPISNDPVEAPYLGRTTTFEGTTSYAAMDYESAKGRVKNVFLSNGFKLTSEENLDKQLVANREVKEGYVTTTVHFYETSVGVNLRVVTQVPRDGTRYYGIHEQFMSQMKL